jgi:hypothetical protein
MFLARNQCLNTSNCIAVTYDEIESSLGFCFAGFFRLDAYQSAGAAHLMRMLPRGGACGATVQPGGQF